ncbi:MAG TPA: hypothetical protein V6C85_38605 [Allocoleopsis sp.]
MSKTSPINFWNLAKPYVIIGRIAILVLGSLAYLHFVESLRKRPKAPRAVETTDAKFPESFHKLIPREPPQAS